MSKALIRKIIALKTRLKYKNNEIESLKYTITLLKPPAKVAKFKASCQRLDWGTLRRREVTANPAPVTHRIGDVGTTYIPTNAAHPIGQVWQANGYDGWRYEYRQVNATRAAWRIISRAF